MAGIYIHIPFCKQACFYCDFHFSSYLALKDNLVDALVKEIEYQQDFFSVPVETIYFGGGTPSLLNEGELEKIFTAISKYFKITPEAEITLEANPDDLSLDKLTVLRKMRVNRLSIGIQSFNDGLLKYLNRLHSADEAIKSYYNARDVGFENINCDLIFAIPGQVDLMLETDLRTLNDLQPEHVSAYCLTVEEKTVFGNWLRKRKIREVDEEQATQQMLRVWEFLSRKGYDHYEISNFCRDGFYSRHNSAYWKDRVYLGIGPGAHSYDGKNRHFNISNNSLYIKAIRQGKIPSTIDTLSVQDQINEYLLTSLRTKWGCDLHYMEKKFGFQLLQVKRAEVDQFIEMGFLSQSSNCLRLTRNGKVIADHISAKLFA